MRGDLEPAGPAGWTGRGGDRRLAPRALQDLHMLSLSPGAAGTWKAPNPRPVPLTLIGVSPAGASYLPGAQERNAGVRTGEPAAWNDLKRRVRQNGKTWLLPAPRLVSQRAEPARATAALRRT